MKPPARGWVTGRRQPSPTTAHSDARIRLKPAVDGVTGVGPIARCCMLPLRSRRLAGADRNHGSVDAEGLGAHPGRDLPRPGSPSTPVPAYRIPPVLVGVP